MSAKPSPAPYTDRYPLYSPGPHAALKGTDKEPERWIVVADNGTKPFLIAAIENGQPGDCCETEGGTARLFAAAHDLLLSLKDIVSFCDDPDAAGTPGNMAMGVLKRLGAARAAINKATKIPS